MDNVPLSSFPTLCVVQIIIVDSLIVSICRVSFKTNKKKSLVTFFSVYMFDGDAADLQLIAIEHFFQVKIANRGCFMYRN